MMEDFPVQWKGNLSKPRKDECCCPTAISLLQLIIGPVYLIALVNIDVIIQQKFSLNLEILKTFFLRSTKRTNEAVVSSISHFLKRINDDIVGSEWEEARVSGRKKLKLYI